jgi:hypothetical protein
MDAYHWWCATRWTEDGAAEIGRMLQAEPGMEALWWDLYTWNAQIAAEPGLIAPARWRETQTEDLIRLAFNGIAVSKGVRTCLPSGLVDGDDPSSQRLRHLYYWLLVIVRSAGAVDDPFRVLGGAMFYELAGRVASRELASRTRRHLGASAALVFLLQSVVSLGGATGPVERGIEREMMRLRKSVLGTVLSRPNGTVIGRVSRILEELDPNARRLNAKRLREQKLDERAEKHTKAAPGVEVDSSAWERIMDTAGELHPLAALILSLTGKWNFLPEMIGWDMLNRAEYEVGRHNKRNARDGSWVSDPVGEDKTQDEDPLNNPPPWEADHLLRHAREHESSADEVAALREEVDRMISAADSISPRFGRALREAETGLDLRADLVRAVAAKAEVSPQQARDWLRRLKERLGRREP